MFNRKYNSRKPYKKIYIFTEGIKTEVNYFESKRKEIEQEIRRKNITIKITGMGKNTISLFNFVINFINEQNIDLNTDECWIVFDKDNYNANFDGAINKALAKGLKVAYSNACFELWYLLHFCYMDSAIDQKEYPQKLTDHLRNSAGDKKIEYSKNSENIYFLIKDKESDAIKNAKKLLSTYGNKKSFSKNNPSTTVHLLVENLNNLKTQGKIVPGFIF
ncbi:MAG: RloB family protein [Patescibacteria group bacterium]|jgi:hypothetical protein